MVDLDELQTRAERADTPSPWEAYTRGYDEPWWVRHDSEHIVYLGYDVIADLTKNDAEFIAAANPKVILSLIDEIRGLRAAIRDALDFEAILPAIATKPREILTNAIEGRYGHR